MTRFGKVAAFAISFGLLGGLTGGASALAGESGIVVAKVSVAYGDLNLSTQAGNQVLLARVRSAAALACGGRPDTRDIKGMTRFQTCAKEAMDSAVIRIGAPKLTALYGLSLQEVASAK
jgi:UrcA family protein